MKSIIKTKSVWVGMGTFILLIVLMGLGRSNRVSADATEKVKTIRWQAALTADVKVRIHGKKVKLRAGKKVVVVKRKFSTTGSSGKSTIQVKGVKVKVSNSKLFFIRDLCSVTETGDYSRETKEAFVNKRRFPSRTPYLIWISLDKQRVNVFTGPKSGGQWKLIKRCKCSTGKAETPTTPHWNADISFKAPKYKYFKNNGYLNWFSEVSGSGIHQWVGSNRKALLGKHTASNGCIRVSAAHAKWIFDTIPVKTRVVIW